VRNGKGTYILSDGRKYIGDFVNDQKDGIGEFWWPDGRHYSGAWKDGFQEGKGSVTLPDGKTFTTIWRKGAPDKAAGSLQDDALKTPANASYKVSSEFTPHPNSLAKSANNFAEAAAGNTKK